MWAAHRGEIGHVDPKFSKKFFAKIDNNIIALAVFLDVMSSQNPIWREKIFSQNSKTVRDPSYDK